MRIILGLLSFILFMILAFAAMFLGGVSGVAGTFFMMVKEGDIQSNLEVGIVSLVVSLLFVIILRGQNKKVLRQRKQLAQQHTESDEASQG